MRLDLTGLAYLAALGLAAFVGYKIYKGGVVVAGQAADAINAAVRAVGDPIARASSAITDALYTETPAERSINSPVSAPPPVGHRTGNTLFPSGEYVGDFQDVTGYYSSPYALMRDAQ